MAQLDTIASDIAGYASDTEAELELSQIKLLSTLDNTADNFIEFTTDVDLYLVAVKYKDYIDAITTELNARETATIDGGAF
tara:strand:+ start:275 stop:517 length:243 start_codon:yes stop_codon:yes gene_type:complete